jgi:AbrB family looped-hinge helix DNA binding protein
MMHALLLYYGITRIVGMKEIVSTITGKGQVTIPAEVRRSLGVAPSDKVTFVIDEAGKVELRPVRYTVADLKGIVPALPGRETIDFEDIIAEAFEERFKDHQ